MLFMPLSYSHMFFLFSFFLHNETVFGISFRIFFFFKNLFSVGGLWELC